MSGTSEYFGRILPHRAIRAALLFRRFARANGLVYFGTLRPEDDHQPVRGFTVSAGQIDKYAMYGSAHGREVAIVERRVTHGNGIQVDGHKHSHTWLIASARHEVVHSPHVLLLSHQHPRLRDEAIAIQHDRSEHVAVDYRLDANFLIYAKKSAVADFHATLSDELIEALIAHPQYDYEFDGQSLYVYGHVSKPTPTDLTRILSTLLSLTDLYESGIKKSPR